MRCLRLLLVFLPLLTDITTIAQNVNRIDSLEVIGVIDSFFKALKEQDTLKLKILMSLVDRSVAFETVRGNTGNSTSWKGFLGTVSMKPDLFGGACNYHFSNYSVRIVEGFASVLLDYKCTRSNKGDYCGAYSFHAVKPDRTLPWRIKHVLRVIKEGGCDQ